MPLHIFIYLLTFYMRSLVNSKLKTYSFGWSRRAHICASSPHNPHTCSHRPSAFCGWHTFFPTEYFFVFLHFYSLKYAYEFILFASFICILCIRTFLKYMYIYIHERIKKPCYALTIVCPMYTEWSNGASWLGFCYCFVPRKLVYKEWKLVSIKSIAPSYKWWPGQKYQAFG